MSISMYLSLDTQLSSDDVQVPVHYTSSQTSQLRQGVPAALGSPAEYVLDGDKFNVSSEIINKINAIFLIEDFCIPIVIICVIY